VKKTLHKGTVQIVGAKRVKNMQCLPCLRDPGHACAGRTDSSAVPLCGAKNATPTHSRQALLITHESPERIGTYWARAMHARI